MIEILLHGWRESICLILYTPENIDTNDTNHLNPTLWPPKKVQHLTRTEKFAIILHIIGHTKATKSEILLRIRSSNKDGGISRTTVYFNQSPTEVILDLNYSPQLDKKNTGTSIWCIEHK